MSNRAGLHPGTRYPQLAPGLEVGENVTMAERGSNPAEDRRPAPRIGDTRPRDELGRPLGYGATGVAPIEEGVIRTPWQTLALAQQLLDAGRPFQAHEVFEGTWKSGPAAERVLWQGLAQLAVAQTHRLRGNAVGAQRLTHRGAANLDSVAAREAAAGYGIDLAALLAWAAGDAAAAMPRLIAESG